MSTAQPSSLFKNIQDSVFQRTRVSCAKFLPYFPFLASMLMQSWDSDKLKKW